jgi:hypothetical protein
MAVPTISTEEVPEKYDRASLQRVVESLARQSEEAAVAASKMGPEASPAGAVDADDLELLTWLGL